MNEWKNDGDDDRYLKNDEEEEEEKKLKIFVHRNFILIEPNSIIIRGINNEMTKNKAKTE
ncbi:hypothetical protein BLA29_007667 [Euroglyphus maynei]|uniref:Uncharacterized protein n=1 Tax=Euroglyphus maynei TaxID=6958 RepID=A0A1Y3BQR7_EURMA|nr:hypothetical protein BLA29_007667 [Euroglyphus maynei]